MALFKRTRDRVIHVRGLTWLSEDQIGDNQLEHAATLLTPRPDEPALVSTLLLPWHLRRQPATLGPLIPKAMAKGTLPTAMFFSAALRIGVAAGLAFDA
jgi:hypothetical protein